MKTDNKWSSPRRVIENGEIQVPESLRQQWTDGRDCGPSDRSPSVRELLDEKIRGGVEGEDKRNHQVGRKEGKWVLN